MDNFVKIRCPDCQNEQIIFQRAATKIVCNVCGATLVTPKGGVADIRGERLEVVG